MDNVEFVNILDSCNNLLENGACLILWNSILFQVLLFRFDDIVEQLSRIHVLHDQEKLLGSLDDLIKLNY